jgi:peptide deformylase
MPELEMEVCLLAIRRILDSSHAVLRGQARPVKAVNETILRLLDDMAETMYDAPGVGLAAPQIGIAKQLVVADPGDNRLVQLVNPRIVIAEGEAIDVEGCLSLPGVFGEVPRAERVAVAALDRRGREMQLKAEGLLARILQHEIDHLHGVLLIDRAIRLLDREELDGRKNGAGA